VKTAGRKEVHSFLAVGTALAVLACAPTVRRPLGPADYPRTRAEQTGYRETSHYADVRKFLDSLRKLQAPLAFGSIGKTTEGRDIPYVIASRPVVAAPSEAERLGRPIVYVQGNIHAGEVEGKDALLALLRDLTFSTKPNVLDSIVLIAVPIYNAEIVACPQLPTTLPTLDELIGVDGITVDNVADHLLELSRDALEGGHVYTLHAELEGLKLLPVFERLLQGWMQMNYKLVSLGDYFGELPNKDLPRHDVAVGELPGRSGTLSLQGGQFLA